ncbi:EamA family transporter [Labrenzia sp. OB1]|uniref:EamA family transporter n=1 Tax=Labrenzia sp. OB1 TaxID=1561204 RepID=UPI00083965C4|nr:EamA family transporter [Labrenzia sp. OB1]
MFRIAVAFGLLVHTSLTRDEEGQTPPAAQCLFGAFAALACALAYVTRKIGLEQLPDPAPGTIVSALAGLAAVVAVILVSRRQRSSLRDVFRNLDLWIVLSAAMVSEGQILLFAALPFERVSKTAMIASLEIFVSMFLSTVVFKTEGRPSSKSLCWPRWQPQV